ncbi:MAG: hypothetical protein KC940_25250 [Candidatus Omnitrophica bacterium]|nr:hypothetical protein [Candidatus Omnitrophota bacterium]MCA9433853.1 hypothetical protein [Candidatus Omnitrophota bacterium]MCB9766707.1 hypothetical protein [Candidatus Omnitrophota bacterium]MCB9783757.1 hypothetical protein [Candidatus Omnitrophota bacterium]
MKKFYHPLYIVLFTLVVFSAPFLTDFVSAQGVEIIENGSFEAGNFTGWTAQTAGFASIPWNVIGAGSVAGTGMQPSAPQDGSYVAWNGFDGGGPMNFILFQDVSIPADNVATLSWAHRVQWNFSIGRPATLPRVFDVLVRDPTSGAVLETLLTFETGIQSTTPTGDTGWTNNSFDLSAYAGQTVRIEFVEYIPEVLTGYGQFELDSVSLVVEQPVVEDPPAASLFIDIRPWMCPNLLNLRSRCYIPVAILGTEDLDVRTIDPTSIQIAGATPRKGFYWDVAAPVESSDSEGECRECRRTRRDGYHDLVVFFKSSDLVDSLREQYGEEIEDLDCVNLTLTCTTDDGASLSGEDSVKLVGQKHHRWSWRR